MPRIMHARCNFVDKDITVFSQEHLDAENPGTFQMMHYVLSKSLRFCLIFFIYWSWCDEIVKDIIFMNCLNDWIRGDFIFDISAYHNSQFFDKRYKFLNVQLSSL